MPRRPTERTTPRLLSGRALAKVLGVSHSQIYRQTKAGNLPSIRIGGCVRYDPDDVLAYLKAQHVEPAGQADCLAT